MGEAGVGRTEAAGKENQATSVLCKERHQGGKGCRGDVYKACPDKAISHVVKKSLYLSISISRESYIDICVDRDRGRINRYFGLKIF